MTDWTANIPRIKKRAAATRTLHISDAGSYIDPTHLHPLLRNTGQRRIS